MKVLTVVIVMVRYVPLNIVTHLLGTRGQSANTVP
jgi:hypothetical protein